MLNQIEISDGATKDSRLKNCFTWTLKGSRKNLDIFLKKKNMLTCISFPASYRYCLFSGDLNILGSHRIFNSSRLIAR